MKNYLTIASVLGVIAFASVSFLAKADQQPGVGAATVVAQQDATSPAASDPSDGEAAADNAAAAPSDQFAKDDQECATQAATPGKDGAAPSDADKDTAYKKCMLGKGHTDDEMKSQSGGDAGKSDGDEGKEDQGAPSEE